MLRGASFALLGALSIAEMGCTARASRHLTEAPDAKQLSQDSAIANGLLRAFDRGEVGSVEKVLDARLSRRLSTKQLKELSLAVRRDFGRPQSLVEERVHEEGELRWYTGTYVYTGGSLGQGSRGRVLVLLRFALDERDKIAHLTLRDHPFADQRRHPAERYLMVNRFHFMSIGEWSTIHGGRSEATNKHHGHREQRFAYDLMAVQDGKKTKPGSKADGKHNEDYYSHGLPLFAPAPGRVIFARDGVHENKPPNRGKGGGNGVIIDHGFGEVSFLWHMIPGTVAVKEGDEVEWGQYLGKVGNSGRSTAPHIHWHVATGRGKPNFGLPAPFVDVVIDGNERGVVMPLRGQVVQTQHERSFRRAFGRANRVAQGPRVLIDV